MEAKVNKKAKPIIKGQNIRFSSDGHEKIVKYCKANGYSIGAFCEVTILRFIDLSEIGLSH